jgi:hypothetical protein
VVCEPVSLGRAGLGEPVAGGSALDDLPGVGEPVDDGRAEPRVGEGLGPAIRGWHMFGLENPGRCLGYLPSGVSADL